MRLKVVLKESQFNNLIKKLLIKESAPVALKVKDGNILYKNKEYTIEAKTENMFFYVSLDVNSIIPDPKSPGDFIMYYDVLTKKNQTSKLDGEKINLITTAIDNGKLPYKTVGTYMDKDGEMKEVELKIVKS